MGWHGFAAFPASLLGIGVALFVVTISHELGHYMAARLVGIPVKQIAVGMGPEVWRLRLRSGVRFVLRLAPVGAAVGVLGRWSKEGKLRRPVEHDLLVASAGPLASFVLTLLLFFLAMGLGAESVFRMWLIATALLSTVVALLNLLPLPGLDGGHILLLLASKLGFQVSPQQEIKVHRYGLRLIALICIMVLAVQMIVDVGQPL